MTRAAVRDRYDAVLDFAPLRAVPEVAYALVKQTYKIVGDRCVLDQPEPLAHDLRDDALEPRLPPGSDFWFQKEATDVVVQGSAHAHWGRPVREMTVGVTVGEATKSVRVFGERMLEWRGDGTPIIPEPEPFTEIPLTYANAYGGIDPRLEMQAPRNPDGLREFDLCDYPGLYPRNLHGRGYLVEHGPLPLFKMPNLENPNDLLTSRRLVVGDPALWYKQPLPWCFDWTNAVMFPRMVYIGLAPRFPPPVSSALPEIESGILSTDYQAKYLSLDESESVPAEYYQEASFGMTFSNLAPGTPIVLEGMHPDRPSIVLRLPAPPSIDLFVGGSQVPAIITLTNCVISPADERMCLVYAALVTDMPRVFIPGVHKEIPFKAAIDGDAPLEYESPLPVLEQLEARE
jgi:hypothetical protein